MSTSARTTLWIGIIFLILSVVNFTTTESISPALQRAEALSALASIGLILTAFLWTEFIPKQPRKVVLKGEQGFVISEKLHQQFKTELAWGSQMILTTTAAITVLIYWNKETILMRGLINEQIFTPGPICERSINSGRLISLVNTKAYPGSHEFDSVLDNLPSIIIYPLKLKGVLIIGGSSERCFTLSDEKWITGWVQKIEADLDMI